MCVHVCVYVHVCLDAFVYTCIVCPWVCVHCVCKCVYMGCACMYTWMHGVREVCTCVCVHVCVVHGGVQECVHVCLHGWIVWVREGCALVHVWVRVVECERVLEGGGVGMWGLLSQ